MSFVTFGELLINISFTSKPTLISTHLIKFTQTPTLFTKLLKLGKFIMSSVLDRGLGLVKGGTHIHSENLKYCALLFNSYLVLVSAANGW